MFKTQDRSDGAGRDRGLWRTPAAIADIGGRSWREGALAFLPTEEHLLDARVWLACCELGRSEHQVGEVVASVRQDDRELLDVLTDRVLDETGLDVLAAVVEGLVAAVCAPEQPFPLARARAALRSALPTPVQLTGGEPAGGEPMEPGVRSSA